MFYLNDLVVYAGHGVARVSRIFSRRVGGHVTDFFELTFLSKQMTILVPVANASMVGIRQLSARNTVDAVFKLLAEPTEPLTHADAVTTNWNKRNKEYQSKIRTGNLAEIGQIYRDLKALERYKGLSFGEKSLLQQTEMLLVEEIALVYSVSEEEAQLLLRSFVNQLRAKPSKHPKIDMEGFNSL